MNSEIMSGLKARRKQVSPKFLYDKRGSRLFEQISRLKEYYPTKTEQKILKANASEIAAFIGPHVMLIEPGCGNCEKAQILIPKFNRLAAYIPIDISEEFLLKCTQRLQKKFPKIPVIPRAADFNQQFGIPDQTEHLASKRVVFFPGSTIGNLSPKDALALLKRFRKLVGQGGGLLIGVDIKKDECVLHRAYNDRKGVTAKFNLNLLKRLNRELHAHFNLSKFKHESFYNSRKNRIEMHLVSQTPQTVRIGDDQIQFDSGETIHTENSYKYAVDEFIALADRAGFKAVKQWQDRKKYFCVYYFEA